MNSQTVLPSPDVVFTTTRDMVMPEITSFLTFAFGISALFLIVKSFYRA